MTAGGERSARRFALGTLGFMIILFIALSAFSFLGERGQVSPEAFSFAGRSAVEGKRVFQNYNCMGCHTLVGNGAYFGPDLTDVHEAVGPAWLGAFLPSSGTWPTREALAVQVSRLSGSGLLDSADLEAYFDSYPGARERVERRGGQPTHMPNLPLTAQEIDSLIAFLAYTSAMDTEGWPPQPAARPAVVERVRQELRPEIGPALVAPAAALPAPPADGTTPAGEGPGPAAVAAPTPADPERGRALAAQFGCTACHSLDTRRLVGPGWGGLYGSTETLADGSTVLVDDAYLVESIVDPDARVVQGYPAGVMPSFATLLSEQEIQDIVAFIAGLQEGAR